MSKINDMTMSEIVAEAINRGFDPKPWNGKFCNWSSGIEVAAIKHLQTCGSDLFEETEED